MKELNYFSSFVINRSRFFKNKNLGICKPFTIPSKKFPIVNSNDDSDSDYFLLNKFGLHLITKCQSIIDITGYGYCFQKYNHHTINFNKVKEFLDSDYFSEIHKYDTGNYSKTANYNEILGHIYENHVILDESKKTKIHLKIIDHTSGKIKMTKNSVIYQDNNIVFDNSSNEHIFTVNADQWCFLFLEHIFIDLSPVTFVNFSNCDKEIEIETQNRKYFKLLEYSPGGLTNIGTLDDGVRNEYYISSEIEYDLIFIISPAFTDDSNKRTFHSSELEYSKLYCPKNKTYKPQYYTNIYDEFGNITLVFGIAFHLIPKIK